MRPFILLHCLVAVIGTVNAQPIHPIEQKTEPQLEQLYHTEALQQKQRVDDRLQWLTNQSLTKPYILFPLGEGLTGAFDQQPRYRLDGFDCGTFVSTQLALALSNSPASFKQCLNKIRYHSSEACFLGRNHFTSIDWNRSNQKQGLIKDITSDIKDSSQKPIYKQAVGDINKAAWYQHASKDRIKLFETSRSEIKARVHALKQAGKIFKPQTVSINYLPLSSLMHKNGQLNLNVIKQIPNGAIMEVIRPNWDLKDKIGTNLHVSHLGFIFWINDKPFFRHASSEEHAVSNVPLQTYLQKMGQSPTIKGVNIQVVPFETLSKSPCLESKSLIEPLPTKQPMKTSNAVK